MTGFRFNEKYLSQIPALQLLINLGYEYLPPEQVMKQRQGKTGNVLLEGILREQLKRLNRINYKGREFLFSHRPVPGRHLRPPGFPRIVRMPLFHNSRTGWHNPAGFEASARTLQHKWAGFGPIHTLCGVIDASGAPACAA